MIKLLVKLIITALAVFVTAGILSGVEINNFGNALVAAVVLSFLNHIIKPVLSLLALPITLLTLGVFQLVINITLIMVASWLVEGFTVDGILSALLFSIILSVVSWFLNLLAGD